MTFPQTSCRFMIQLPSLWALTLSLCLAPIAISTAADSDLSSARMPSGAPQITITAPAHGAFTMAPSVMVSGRITPANTVGQLQLNGLPTVLKSDGTFTREIALDTARLIQPMVAELTSSDTAVRSRITVIRGVALTPEVRVPEGLGLRLNASGIDRIEPALAKLAQVDPVSLLPPGPVFNDDVCIEIPPFGTEVCGRANVQISHDPPPQFAQVQVDAAPAAEMLNVTLRAYDLFVRAEVMASAGPISTDCKFDIRAAVISATGAFALEPMVNDPAIVDVIQQGPMAVDFDAFTHNPDCGDLPDEVVDRLISLFIGSVQERLRNGLADFLNTVDAVGNTPLASALETTLADLSPERLISEIVQEEAPVGLQSMLPFNRITEEPSGITLSTDTHIFAGNAEMPPACNPPPGTPAPVASYDVPASLPPFLPTTPAPNALPYDIALTISISSLNQFLSAVTSCGLLQTTLSTLDVGGMQQPITAGLMGAFVPAFQHIAPGTPLVIQLRPTLPPIVTEMPGPAGEAVDVRMLQFLLEIIDAATSETWLQVSIDLRLGLGIVVDAAGTLQPQLGSVTELTSTILDNVIGAEPAGLQQLLSQLLALAPQFNTALPTVTLPTFLDFALSAVAFAPQDGYLTLFMGLVPMP